MEGGKSDVLLLGAWASSYCKRVELALKLKGIPYTYVEEDLTNKSELLLHYNPVHKKVPVLVHEDKSISESFIILEYVDEYWNHSPKLLPEDPCDRAKVRFWTNFYDQKITPAFFPLMRSEGEELEKQVEDFYEIIKVFEEGMKRDFPGKFPFYNGETLGLLDIVVATNLCNYEAFHEAVCVIFTAEKTPQILSWVNALKDHPLIRETLFPHNELVAKLREVAKKMRETLHVA